MYLTAGFCLMLAFTGCSNQESKEKTAESQEAKPAVQQVQPEAAQQAHAPQPESSALQGTIVESFDSAGYTYLQIDNGAEKIWAAISPAKVAVGDEISLHTGAVMENFYSRSIDRTFEKIVFSSGIKGAAAPAHGAMMASSHGKAESGFMDAMKSEGVQYPMPQGAGAASLGMGSSKAIVPFQELKVEKAAVENGVTVEEVYLRAAELNGQKITIKGKVVKFSPNIMGRNWLHLQDGSGNPMKNTHDLVVTTAAVVEQDAVVQLEGILATEKDFGAGYFYAVIVEEAVLQ